MAQALTEPVGRRRGGSGEEGPAAVRGGGVAVSDGTDAGIGEAAGLKLNVFTAGTTATSATIAGNEGSAEQQHRTPGEPASRWAAQGMATAEPWVRMSAASARRIDSGEARRASIAKAASQTAGRDRERDIARDPEHSLRPPLRGDGGDRPSRLRR